MTIIYCMGCRKKTQSTAEHMATTKTGKGMIKGKCVNCGCKKSRFVGRRQAGGSVVDSIISRIPELHLWTPWSGKHSFTGPGTRLDKRLDKDNKPHAWSKPVNSVDASLRHDLCYG